MKSTFSSQHQFSQTPSAEIPRSTFDRSHTLITTLPEGGKLYPVLVDEALPGDTISLKMETLCRLATPVHPAMDNMRLTSFFFAVPNRLIWTNWEKFNGAQDSPGDSTDFLIPTLNHATGWPENSIGDHFGLPTQEANTICSALPFRAHNLIFNQHFRDENLQTPLVEISADVGDATGMYLIMNRGKRHDYFSSSLPFAQKGTSVTLPLGTTAPVVSVGDGEPSFKVGSEDDLKMRFNVVTNIDIDQAITGDGAAEWDDTKLEADLTNATAATINELRQAFAIQKLYERDARGGTRYIEVIKSHFNVSSPDSRMQRSEYLGGGTQTINITPIPQTSSTDGTSPQGNLAAYGVSSGSNHGFTKSFTEHCIILGYVCVTADLTYQQGMERMWSRQTRWDFFWPELQHIGEQAVLNKEIYWDTAGGTNDDVWGYQPRFDEYRYKPSRVTGAMRSNAATPLDSWHLAQNFSTLPVLDATFIKETPPIGRIVAVPSEPHFLFNANLILRHTRPMPTYSIPGMGSRF